MAMTIGELTDKIGDFIEQENKTEEPFKSLVVQMYMDGKKYSIRIKEEE